MEERKLSVADCVSDFPRLIMLPPEPPLIIDALPPPPTTSSCDVSSFDDWGGCFLDDDFLDLLEEPIICDIVIGGYYIFAF